MSEQIKIDSSGFLYFEKHQDEVINRSVDFRNHPRGSLLATGVDVTTPVTVTVVDPATPNLSVSNVTNDANAVYFTLTAGLLSEAEYILEISITTTDTNPQTIVRHIKIKMVEYVKE
jgi:hypothetical protein